MFLKCHGSGTKNYYLNVGNLSILSYYDDGSLATEDYLDEYLYYDEVLETFTRFSQYEYDEYGNTIKTLSRYNDGEEIYEAYYTYTPVAFPAGKTGDMFTQKITTQNKSDDETYERYVIYRHK